MKNGFVAAIVSVLSFMGATSGHAAAVFDNITANPGEGDCSFSTTCAASVGRGDDFAAQAFTLASGATLTSATFAEIDYGVGPTAANWMVLSAAGGLPGQTLASGSSAIVGSATIGSYYYYTVSSQTFDLGSVSLGAGDYFFAVQAVSPVFQTYLAQGSVNNGAAETFDGGATWQANYEGIGGIGLALSGSSLSAVPLPASLPMFGASLLALGGIGFGLKRRGAVKTGCA